VFQISAVDPSPLSTFAAESSESSRALGGETLNAWLRRDLGLAFRPANRAPDCRYEPMRSQGKSSSQDVSDHRSSIAASRVVKDDRSARRRPRHGLSREPGESTNPDQSGSSLISSRRN
jgi:hypothetical protein